MFFITIICVILIFWFFKSIYIIPARHFAIVEYFGRYSHTIHPGINIVIWPLYYLRYIHWTWENKHIRGYMASCENCQMDIKPINCVTKDQLQLNLDSTLFYNINNPSKAIYQSDDVVNLFYQTATQAIRNISNRFTYKDLNGQDNVLGSHIKDYINEKLKDKYGITCIEFLVQSIITNSEVAKKSTEIFLSSNDKEAQIEAIKLEAEKIKILREARGYTVEQEIELERAKNQKFILVSNWQDLKNF